MFHRSRRLGAPSAPPERPLVDVESAEFSQDSELKHRSSDLSFRPDQEETSPARNATPKRPRIAEAVASHPTLSRLVLLLVSVLLLILIFSSQRLSKGWWALILISSPPILLATSVVVGAPYKTQPHQRLIALFFVGSILCGQLPRFLNAALVAAALLIFSLSTRPILTLSSQHDNNNVRQGQLRAAVAAILTTLTLMVENFFVWVVSATYTPSHRGSPTPLQDNGRLFQQHVLDDVLGMQQSQVRLFRATLNVQWALVAGLAAAFVTCELQWVANSNRTLWGLVQRALLTLALVRILRTVSFTLTVLPSQQRDCYRRHHFPVPPPEDWWNWIMVGLSPQAHGGCNDLIISGHACVTTVLACVSTSVAGHWVFSIALWLLLALDYCVEVYEGFHYSVDMWMGALLTSLLWRVVAFIEEQDHAVPKREFHPIATTSAATLARYAIPSLGAYLAIAVFPESTGNYWLLLYISIPGLQIARDGFSHQVQHELFCMLYIALGTYL